MKVSALQVRAAVQLLSIMLLSVVQLSCSVKTPVDGQGFDERDRQKIVQLESMLLGLGEKVDAEEARQLADESIAYAYRLAERYDLVWPPLWHNTLVNLGMKERGLCHQWADDMLAYMSRRSFDSFDFYLGVARQGTLWEHNTVVVSAKGMPFEQGVVLDPWRDSGELYFARVSEDEKYRWQQRDD